MTRHTAKLCCPAYIRFLFCVLIGAVIVSMFAHHTYAAEPFNITSSPTSFDLSGQPGGTITQMVKIRNNASTPVTLQFSIKKLIAGAKGDISLTDFGPTDTYQHWLTFQTASATASPNDWVEMPFTIHIPTDASLGYYFALYIAPLDTPGTAQEPAAHLNGSVAIPVLLSVRSGKVSISGAINSFTTSPFSEYLPVNFDLTYHNTSNIHVRPRGDIFIKDATGKEVAILPINPSASSVIPGMTKDFMIPWDDSFITQETVMQNDMIVYDSSHHPRTHLVFHFDRLLHMRIGRYTATALVVVPGDTQDYSYESSTSFWIIPWEILTGALLLATFTLAGIFFTIKGAVQTTHRLIQHR